ncbi:hypothetical protein HYV89_01250 [Candidatus Woesearchaeota archaeon]|nr:hypothetical protein [Candidatus Woesearchaeota archaeon]
MRDDVKKIIERQYRTYVLDPYNRDNPDKQEEYRRKILEEVKCCVRRKEIDIVFASDVIKYLGYE